jgi:polysaccharide export outer membrane protein
MEPNQSLVEPKKGEGWNQLRGCVRGVMAGMGAWVVLAFSGCETPTGGVSATPISAEDSQNRTSGVLSAGDVISVTFSGVPEHDQTQKIGANGRVSLPLIGAVTAAGKDVSRFQSELAGRYKSKLQDPGVTVSVVTTASAVYVSGAVNEPKKIPLDRPLTAREAVMEAGGFSPLANPKQVVVIRTVNGQLRRYVLNLDQAFIGPGSRAFYLQPSDMIEVKESFW